LFSSCSSIRNILLNWISQFPPHGMIVQAKMSSCPQNLRQFNCAVLFLDPSCLPWTYLSTGWFIYHKHLFLYTIKIPGR
jgi:hypothetical protein